MYVDMLGNDDLISLKHVYDQTGQTLGLGSNADDDRRRNEVAKAIISLAKGDPRIRRAHDEGWLLKAPARADLPSEGQPSFLS